MKPAKPRNPDPPNRSAYKATHGGTAIAPSYASRKRDKRETQAKARSRSGKPQNGKTGRGWLIQPTETDDMGEDEMKIYIHSQCAGSGIAGTRYLGDRNGDMPDDECDDYLIYYGSESYLLAEADSLDILANRSGAGTSAFWRRVASSLREAVS